MAGGAARGKRVVGRCPRYSEVSAGLLMRLLLVVLSLCCLTAAQPWPTGVWETQPGEVVTYNFNKADPLILIYGRTVTTGWAFQTYQVYQPLSAPLGQYLYANFSGSVGCTPRFYLIISVEASSCTQRGWPSPPFCQLAPDAFGGTYEYSVTKDFNGDPAIIVKNWGGVLWPYTMTCASGETCSTYYNCNSTVVNQVFFDIVGGSQTFNGPTTVILNNSDNVTFTGDQITVENSNVTISTGDTDLTINTDDSTVNMGDVTTLNIYANNLTSPGCGGVAWFQSVQTTNFTVSSNSPIDFFLMPSVLPGFADFSSDWSVLPPVGWTFDGEGPTEYEIEVCVKASRAFFVNANDTFTFELGVGTNLEVPTQWSSFRFPLSSTSPSLLLPSLCVSNMFLLNNSDIIAVYVGSTSDLAATWYVGPGSTQGGGAGLVVTFQAYPTSCEDRPVVNNNTFNLDITFNASHLDVGCGLNKTFDPDTNNILLGSTGLKSIRTNSAPKIQDCRDARLVDTTTAGWSSSGSDMSVDVLLDFLAVGSCYSVSRSGKNVTYTYNGPCTVNSNSAFLTASIVSQVLQLNYNGLNRVRANTDGSWLVGDVTFRVSPGLTITTEGNDILIAPNSTTSSNDTSCISCGPNGTLTVEKLCSRQAQCTVEADPPSSDPGGPVPQICWRCGSNGGGGDDGGGGGAPPIIPPIPPLPPFFIILIPPIVGVPGSGTPGSGLPAVAVPIITNCSDDTVNSDGMKIPRMNFSESVPCCQNTSYGWTILETGSIPNYQFICKRIGDATYAWVPNAEATGAAFNVSTYNIGTTQVFTNSSTTVYDSTSQFITYGPSYQDKAYFNTVFINGTLSIPTTHGMPPTPAGEPALNYTYIWFDLDRGLFLFYRGGDFDGFFYNEVIIGGIGNEIDVQCDPTETGNQCTVGLADQPTFKNGFIVTETPPQNPTFPPQCIWTCSGPSTSTSEMFLAANSITLPTLTVNGGGDFCGDATPGNQYLFANELLPCDLTSPISSPTGFTFNTSKSIVITPTITAPLTLLSLPISSIITTVTDQSVILALPAQHTYAGTVVVVLTPGTSLVHGDMFFLQLSNNKLTPNPATIMAKASIIVGSGYGTVTGVAGLLALCEISINSGTIAFAFANVAKTTFAGGTFTLYYELVEF